MSAFEARADGFYLHTEPYRVLSGAMHYFRVVPKYWEDRLAKLVLMGLNTLETYVPWNLHEPSPGMFDFNDGLDLERYISLAGNLGLNVIVRPGPYICSEWEFGGLPPWLLADPQMKLRCSYQPYLDAVDRYFAALLPRLAPLQTSAGGPIIAMQVENEYGSYGNDGEYLAHLKTTMENGGIDVLLFTSDGPTDAMLQYGTIPGVLKTINFGSKPVSAYTKLSEYQPEGPRMCMEYWNGWFDHWGDVHHQRDADDAASVLEAQLRTGASVNLYMFHGGTNFGFMNGANHGDRYEPTITSYDDDAPLSEHGGITAKFRAFRRVLEKYVDLPEWSEPEPVTTMAIPAFTLDREVSLREILNDISKPVRRPVPVPMEILGQSYGFILYETRIPGPREEQLLSIRELHDRAHVFVDDRLVAILERETGETSVPISIPEAGVSLRILVENMGRINYGNLITDRKGITEAVLLGQQILFGWDIFPLPFDDVSCIDFGSMEKAHHNHRRQSASHDASWPTFYRGEFRVDDPHDTFFDPDGWAKGVCWVNGHNAGRYWTRGPQRTLYIPGPFLVSGTNEIILFELDSPSPSRSVSFVDTPILAL